MVVDYSAPNDGWSAGHERFVIAMNERKYALYFYWGPFGHANNSAQILKVNDLIDSFDWLSVRKNEPYIAFTNANCNSPLPWPDDLKNTKAGQVNAFFRWKNLADSPEKFEASSTSQTRLSCRRNSRSQKRQARMSPFAGSRISDSLPGPSFNGLLATPRVREPSTPRVCSAFRH